MGRVESPRRLGPYKNRGAGELEAVTVLSEDWNLKSQKHLNSSSNGFNIFFWPPQTQGCVHTQSKINLKEKKKKNKTLTQTETSLALPFLWLQWKYHKVQSRERDPRSTRNKFLLSESQSMTLLQQLK